MSASGEIISHPFFIFLLFLLIPAFGRNEEKEQKDKKKCIRQRGCIGFPVTIRDRAG